MINPQEIDHKWQEFWRQHNVYNVKDDASKPKCYVLDMFPYPSGAGLHVGHPKGYIATDVYSRYKRMQGFNVLHPMGWDAFGLPAENYALKNKVHPSEAVDKNVVVFKNQLNKIGFNFDWSREINTTDPKFYKWTQWCVAKMFEAGLMEEINEPILWCPGCRTGLAMEDLEGANCERCSSLVEKKPLRQWLIKITKYADRMLEDLDGLDWNDSVKAMQRHWIGRKEGINITYDIEGLDETVTCFTTRPDTNFGATFVVVSPEHEFIQRIGNGELASDHQDEVAAYIKASAAKTDIERQDEGKTKTGAFTGYYAINNLNGTKMPIWTSDFVLAHFGTGAVVGVPGHDQRDFDFAQAFDIPIIRVVVSSDGDTSDITTAEQVQEEEGTMVNSEFLDGIPIMAAKEKMMDYLEEKGWGERKVTYRLQDWVFARQRYWGEPFPFVHKKDGTVEVVDLDKLPVELPNVEHYEPSGTGESPLAGIDDWVNLPNGDTRETNTMPQWAGSSWYYLRYLDPQNDEALVDPAKEKYWMGDKGVDLYVGGAEHATRHLIYARFWHKFLYDQGVVSTKEPFNKLINVGLIQAEDGRKMSKRWGNVINPDDVIEQYGADAYRMYTMFMGPFTQAVNWSTQGVEGVSKFLKKYINLFEKELTNEEPADQMNILHKTIKKVGSDIENFSFNTAVSQMMILVNELRSATQVSKHALKELTLILAPFAPHLAEEMMHTHFGMGTEDSVVHAQWPPFDEAHCKDDKVTIVVQINGKVRGEFTASPDINSDDAITAAKANENVLKYLDGVTIRKEIYVPGKLVSLVVG